jgi:hypothetical protein
MSRVPELSDPPVVCSLKRLTSPKTLIVVPKTSLKKEETVS